MSVSLKGELCIPSMTSKQVNFEIDEALYNILRALADRDTGGNASLLLRRLVVLHATTPGGILK
jgi:hypothetical protein